MISVKTALLFILTALEVNASHATLDDPLSLGEQVPCLSGLGSTCICVGPCLVPYKNSSDCIPVKCYQWSVNLGKCEETGPVFTPAVVLQAIPVTGLFGAGFGNMGRWDLFGVSMGILFGGLALGCILICCTIGTEKEPVGISCIVSCYNFLLICAVLAWWIYGIVVISNKSVLGPNGCPLH